MADRLTYFMPVELPAKPPENRQGQEAECSKLYVFSRIRLQELVNRVTRYEPKMNLNHKILGRAKATTVHNTEQEGLPGSQASKSQFNLRIVIGDTGQAKACALGYTILPKLRGFEVLRFDRELSP